MNSHKQYSLNTLQDNGGFPKHDIKFEQNPKHEKNIFQFTKGLISYFHSLKNLQKPEMAIFKFSFLSTS